MGKEVTSAFPVETVSYTRERIEADRGIGGHARRRTEEEGQLRLGLSGPPSSSLGARARTTGPAEREGILREGGEQGNRGKESRLFS